MAKNFPKIAIKLIKSNDFPLHFCGICYANRVLAMIKVIPNPTPARMRVSKKVTN